MEQKEKSAIGRYIKAIFSVVVCLSLIGYLVTTEQLRPVRHLLHTVQTVELDGIDAKTAFYVEDIRTELLGPAPYMSGTLYIDVPADAVDMQTMPLQKTIGGLFWTDTEYSPYEFTYSYTSGGEHRTQTYQGLHPMYKGAFLDFTGIILHREGTPFPDLMKDTAPEAQPFDPAQIIFNLILNFIGK